MGNMKRKAATPIVLASLCLAGCAGLTPKTVKDVAYQACELFAAQEGLSVQEVCATAEHLKPWVDSILGANRAAAAAMKRPAPDGGASAE